MKILHCADIHLDSPYAGIDTPAAEVRRRELCAIFDRTVKKAIELGAQLILIAGDLFDRPVCSANAKNEIFATLKSAGVPVVISPGNHDQYTKGGVYTEKDIPENVYIFSSEELGRFDFDELGVSVFGYAFTGGSYENDPLADGVPLSESNINILCAHTDLHPAPSKYAPMTAGAVSRAGFTYAAFGHIHNPPPPQRIGDCTMAYSGFMQSRSFDELGIGGAYLVDIDRETKKVTLDRITESELHYEIEVLDVTGCERDSEVSAKISSLITERGYDKNVALRVILRGAVHSSYTPSAKRIASGGGLSALALLDVRDDTSPNLDLEYLERDMTLRGEVYRELLPSLSSADERERRVASLALKAALAALDKRELTLGLDGE